MAEAFKKRSNFNAATVESTKNDLYIERGFNLGDNNDGKRMVRLCQLKFSELKW